MVVSGQTVSELGNWFNFIAGLDWCALSRQPRRKRPPLCSSLDSAVCFDCSACGAFVDRWSRRMVMIVSDVPRALFALGFLLINKPEDLWIAYVCSVRRRL